MRGVLGASREFGAVSRRNVLRRLGFGAATAAGAGGLVRAVDEFAGQVSATPIAAPQTHEFMLTASEFDWALMDDTVVRVWGYNGQMPGPELRVREGDRLRVTLRNDLPAPTTIHWHGVNVPNAMDGVAGLNQAAVEPGGEFVYEFDATPAGSRWYHSHADPQLQVAIGLYGALIIEPRVQTTAYDREFTYLMAEWDAELTPAVAAGTAPRGAGDKLLRGGELGADFFLLNGRMHGATPPMVVREGDRVLIRLYNVGSMPHAFHTHGHSFTVVATDGNPVPAAAQLVKDTILIGPAERYDLALTANNPGVWMVHCHMEHHMANGMMTLLEYEGHAPTGPAGAFYTPVPGTPSALGQATMSPGMNMSGMATSTAAPTAAPTVAPSPSPASNGPSAAISVVDDRFIPNALQVTTGTTVTWTNNGQDWHDIASFDGSFGSGRLTPGQSYSFRFEHAGTFKYVCKHHFMQGMTGTIIVA